MLLYGRLSPLPNAKRVLLCLQDGYRVTASARLLQGWSHSPCHGDPAARTAATQLTGLQTLRRNAPENISGKNYFRYGKEAVLWGQGGEGG